MEKNLYFQDFISKATDYCYMSEDERRNACDIVSVMLAAFDGDISTDGDSTNKIPRNISITAKVYDIEKWESLKEKLIELLNWVSEDLFNVSFVKNTVVCNTLPLKIPSSQKQCITLFSGGLDSLAGAYYNYSNNILSDYIGYVNKPEEKTKQVKLQRFYNQFFFANGSEVSIREKYRKTKNFPLQSTRSLLYLSLAISKAISNSTKEIRMYENGILSLNPEFGRYTTKTTHPKTIFLYNELLAGLGYDIRILNKFEYQTKGEIIANMDSEFKSQIKNTFTCGKGRAPRSCNHKGQCGVCVPCILRKISLASYDNESFDTEYFVGYRDVTSAPKNFLKDYNSNLGYFEAYVEAIKNNTIFGEISNNQPKFHEDENYLQKQKTMFDKFVSEYERFIEKYGIR